MTVATDSRKAKDSDELFERLMDPKEYASVVGHRDHLEDVTIPSGDLEARYSGLARVYMYM